MARASTTCKIFLLFLLCKCSTALATTSSTEPLIYCPSEIICNQAKNPASCLFATNDINYWDTITSPQNSINAGTYKFSSVDSDFHSWDQYQNHLQTFCIYTGGPSYSPNIIYLWSKKEANLEAFYDKTTINNNDNKWVFINAQPSCKSDSSKSCPLIQESGLVIIDKLTDTGHKLLLSTNFEKIFDIQNYLFIEYEKSPNCWNTKQCKIDIGIENDDLGRVQIGSIIVDMDNKMKIISINQLSNTGIEIKKAEPFNAIDIKELTKPLSLIIDNLTNLVVYDHTNTQKKAVTPIEHNPET